VRTAIVADQELTTDRDDPGFRSPERLRGNERGGGRVVDHVRIARMRERGTEAAPSAVGCVPLPVLPPSNKRTRADGFDTGCDRHGAVESLSLEEYENRFQSARTTLACANF
jgi:hypothetical protein